MRKFGANSSRSCGSAISTSSSQSVLLVVVGVGGWRVYEWQQVQQAAELGTLFESAITLADAGKHDEAETIFGQIAEDGTPAYRTLARLRQAAALAQSQSDGGDRDLSADRRRHQRRAGAARSCVSARRRAADRRRLYIDARKLLEPLAQPGRDFRHAARELLALAAWKAGDRPGAMKWYAAILTDPETPASVADARRDADRAQRGRRQELRAGR